MTDTRDSDGAVWTTESCVRGFHVYKETWEPVDGEMLECLREPDNAEDRYAVAMVKDSHVVGHVPRAISTPCSIFMRKGGLITCEIIGRYRYSRDLPQGGMDVPCRLHFSGQKTDVHKIEKFIKKIKDSKATPEVAEKAVTNQAEDDHTVQPFKKLKHDPYTIPVLDDSDVQSSKLWVTYPRHILTFQDKTTLEVGEQLNDKHINLAQYLLKQQFPSISGLANTLLQEKLKVGAQKLAIQIIYCTKRNHWVTASSKWCKNCDVKVYDSVFSQLDENTMVLVKEMFGPRVNVVNTQKQLGPNDCGLFAIAYMVSIANEEDPAVVKYDQEVFRSHLAGCFVSGKLTMFPKLST